MNALLLVPTLALAYALAWLLDKVVHHRRVPQWDETAHYQRMIDALAQGQQVTDLPADVIAAHKGGHHG